MKPLVIFLFTLVAGSFAVAAWLITQPSFATDGASIRRNADETAATVRALSSHVRSLSVDFSPRNHHAAKGLDAAADYIRSQFASSGIAVETQSYEVNGFRYQNLIARVGPDSTERIVVGAHYDAFGAHPGADDNASGVAGLLELARLLQTNRLNHRVELVAYTLEEPPYFRSEFMGSYVHATRLAKSGARVRLMLSLECIGYFSNAANSQDFPVPGLGLLYPTAGNFIAVVGRFGDSEATRLVRSAMRASTPLPVRSINAPAGMTGIDFSDHMNYWNAGFPALMVTDTAFYRNKAYHTASDTFDRLDYSKMAQVVEGVHAAIIAVDTRP